jgi:hypothetical protein
MADRKPATGADTSAAAMADGIDQAEDSQINVASLEAKWVGWSEDLEETGARRRNCARIRRKRSGPRARPPRRAAASLPFNGDSC